MKFKTNFSVDVHDVDNNGVARMSSIMRYMQSTAQSQLTSNGLSYDELRRRNKAFILSRIKIDVNEPLRSYDNLTAVSYPCESRGYSFLRCYSLERNGVTVARAASIWALINVSDHSLVRVNDFELGLDLHEPNDLISSRFTLPSEMHEVGTYTVNYADLDQNGHMNNTRYPDMYANFLPLDNKRIRTISINYVNEAPKGQRLHVHLAKTDLAYYIRTYREDGKINSDAEIILEDL